MKVYGHLAFNQYDKIHSHCCESGDFQMRNCNGIFTIQTVKYLLKSDYFGMKKCNIFPNSAQNMYVITASLCTHSLCFNRNSSALTH